MSDAHVTPLPPDSMMRVIGSKTEEEFLQVSQEFLRYFQTLGKLKPTDTVLDIGCGCGRMALALLNISATYHGVDVSKEMIDWCQQNITSLNPSFSFDHVDIANDAYNKGGTLKNNDFKIDKGNHYDFIFLTSVFTHLLEDGLVHYLEEIEKALKPDGIVFATFFLLNDESRKLISDKKADWHFIYLMEHGAYFVAGSPESALAYDEDFVLNEFNDNGLSILDMFYGSWCHRDDYLSYQDIIVAQKC